MWVRTVAGEELLGVLMRQKPREREKERGTWVFSTVRFIAKKSHENLLHLKSILHVNVISMGHLIFRFFFFTYEL